MKIKANHATNKQTNKPNHCYIVECAHVPRRTDVPRRTNVPIHHEMKRRLHLGNLKASALTKQNVVHRHSHIVKVNLVWFNKTTKSAKPNYWHTSAWPAGASFAPKTERGRSTFIPGASYGTCKMSVLFVCNGVLTRIIVCCRCLAAVGSVFPMNIQILHLANICSYGNTLDQSQ